MQKISKRSLPLLEQSFMYATHHQCVSVETNSRSRVREYQNNRDTDCPIYMYYCPQIVKAFEEPQTFSSDDPGNVLQSRYYEL